MREYESYNGYKLPIEQVDSLDSLELIAELLEGLEDLEGGSDDDY